MIEPAELMKLAIETSREGIVHGQSPFGCAIAIGDEIVARTHNTVVLTTDITAHAEVNAIRAACKATMSIFLSDAIVATTCEPCPMCMAALHWARVGTVYYGATIADAEDAGFNELQVPASELVRLGGSDVKLESGVLSEECKELFSLWGASAAKVAY